MLHPVSSSSSITQIVVANSESVLGNPWYIVASVAFSASNRPDGVVSVFKFVSEELAAQDAPRRDHQILFRKLKDALFKAGLLTGYAKVCDVCVESL